MNLKFKDEIDSITFENLMEEDGNVIYELSCWALNIKKVVQVLDLFLLKNIWKRKAHDMFFIMLDLKFKTFCLVSSLMGHD